MNLISDRIVNTPKNRLMSALALSVTCAIVNALAGCSSSPVQADAISSFAQGVAQTRRQSDLAFHDANALARQEEIQFILATTQPAFREADFTPALGPDQINEWDHAFAAMETYTSALAALLSPDRAKGFGDASVGLATELKNGKMGKSIPPSVATAFAQVGEALISLRSQSDAKTAMQKADPSIRQR